MLETAGRHWTAERVTNGVRNISNQLSIRRGFSLASEGLGDHARKAGWSAGEDPVDFAAAFGREEPGELPRGPCVRCAGASFWRRGVAGSRRRS